VRVLAEQVVRSMGWVAVSSGAARVTEFVSLAILAIVLSPDDFGLVAVAFLIANAVAVFQGLGLAPALIQRQGEVSDAANTAFTLTVVTGLGLCAAAVVAAPGIVSFFSLEQTSATMIVALLFLKIPIDSFGLIQESLLEKSLRFKLKSCAEVSSAITFAMVSVSMALAAGGAWSIVVGHLAGSAVRTSLLWRLSPHRPSLAFDFGLAKQLIEYGKHIVAFSMINFALFNVDYLIVGKVLGSTALGLYTLAFNISNLPATSLTHVVSRVMFPAYSRLQDNMPRLAGSFLATLRFVSFISIPLGTVILVLSPEFVMTVLGSKWQGAIPVVQALAVLGLVRSLLANVGEVYKSVGRPDITPKIHLAWLLALAPALLLATRYGVAGVGLAETAVAGLIAPFYVLSLNRILDLRWRDLLAAVYPGAMSSLVLAGVLVLLQDPVLRALGVHGFPNLIISGFVAVVAYLLAAFFISRDTLFQLRALLRLLSRPPATVSASHPLS